MKVAMLILALYGPPVDGDWRVAASVVVPSAHCEAEQAKLNRPNSTYRIVCEDEQKLATGAITVGSQVAVKE